jgi:four helix bundle protein
VVYQTLLFTKKNKEMKTFRDLLVWQKSMPFVTEIYKVSKSFPKEETFGLTAQLRRSAVSIPSNISEGYGREGVKDYLRFLNIAIASLFELQTQIEIAYNLGYIKKEEFENLYELSREIERMLSSFIRSIKLKN